MHEVELEWFLRPLCFAACIYYENLKEASEQKRISDDARTFDAVPVLDKHILELHGSDPKI